MLLLFVAAAAACHRLTQPMTIVSLGLTLSTIIAPPLAAGLMSIDAGGLKGWQVRCRTVLGQDSTVIVTRQMSAEWRAQDMRPSSTQAVGASVPTSSTDRPPRLTARSLDQSGFCRRCPPVLY
jgi:hypothetical protein